MLFVSPSGSLVESNRVYPYGEKWMADYGTSNDQKFTTYTRQNDHYTDEVDYALTRYYFYSHAAFMSPDISGANIDLVNTWTKIAGNHTIKGGADVRRLRDDLLQDQTFSPRGVITFGTLQTARQTCTTVPASGPPSGCL